MGIWAIFCELPTKSAANKKDGSKIEGWLTGKGIGNDPNLFHINTWWSVSRQKERTWGLESHGHLADESLQCHSCYLPVHPLTKRVYKRIDIIRRKAVDLHHSNPSKIHADKHCLHPTKNNSAPVFLFAYIKVQLQPHIGQLKCWIETIWIYSWTLTFSYCFNFLWCSPVINLTDLLSLMLDRGWWERDPILTYCQVKN